MKMNLSQKLIFLITFVCVLFVGIDAYTNFTSQKDLYRKAYIDKAKSISYGLDANIKSRDDLQLSNLLPFIQKNIWLYSDIQKIQVSKSDGKTLTVIASNITAEIGKTPDPDNWKAYSEDIIIDTIINNSDRSILRVYSPIHISGKTIGTYQIDLNLEAVNTQINKRLATSGVMYAILLLVVISILIFMLNYILIKPLNTIIFGLREISSGNLERAIHVTSGDEYEEAAHVVNTMAQDIKKYHQKLVSGKEDLEKQVSERAKELEEAKRNLELKLEELKQINSTMIGRELKMIELKKEIEDLKTRIDN